MPPASGSPSPFLRPSLRCPALARAEPRGVGVFVAPCRRAGFSPRNDLLDLVSRQRLVFEQALGDGEPAFALLGKDAVRFPIRLVDQPAHFGIDELGSPPRTHSAGGHGMAQEDLLLVVSISDMAELFGETPAGSPSRGQVSWPDRCPRRRRR